jgi:hypothetical protein
MCLNRVLMKFNELFLEIYTDFTQIKNVHLKKTITKICIHQTITFLFLRFWT